MARPNPLRTNTCHLLLHVPRRLFEKKPKTRATERRSAKCSRPNMIPQQPELSRTISCPQSPSTLSTTLCQQLVSSCLIPSQALSALTRALTPNCRCDRPSRITTCFALQVSPPKASCIRSSAPPLLSHFAILYPFAWPARLLVMRTRLCPALQAARNAKRRGPQASPSHQGQDDIASCSPFPFLLPAYISVQLHEMICSVQRQCV